MCSTWYLVCLWRWKRIILFIFRTQVPTIKILTQLFCFIRWNHWFPAGLWWNLVQCTSVSKCWVSAKVLSPQQRILRSLLMSSRISFCAAAMNSSCWASHATNFTCTLSDTVEVLWRVWKHIFTYGVKVLCGNIAPSHLLWNVLSPVFAQKVLVSTSARMLEIQHIWMWFTSPCIECF